jgi:1,2-diacylglycerol 3-alpha-glucosyltransferase
MQHLNIAFYSDTYLPAVDGVVTSMLDFKRELEKRGHNVYIFASARRKDKRKYGAKDVFLYTGLKFKPYPQYSVALFPYYSSLKLKGLSIDLIHAQTPFMMGFNGLLAAKFGRYPLIGTFHTLINSKSLDTYYPKNKTLKKFYADSVWRYTKFFYRMCDVTIAPSNTISELLNKHQIGNVNVVPNGINLKLFNERVSGEGFRKSMGLRDSDKVLLYVSRISKEKHLDVLLRAMKLLASKKENVKLVVAGSGPAIDECKHLAIKLGIADRTSFLGMVDHNTLPRVYAAGDLLCLPSTFETQGIVSLEAMAVGKPVVGASAMALNELIQNGKNGEKFKPGDYAACAKKIEKVLNNYEGYRRHALSTAKSYSTERVTDKLIKIYELLVSKQAVY